MTRLTSPKKSKTIILSPGTPGKGGGPSPASKTPPKFSRVQFAKKLLDWYDKNCRDLPWRTPPNSPTLRADPYAVLVSELMLQQTQVATVIPFFQQFMLKYPKIADLANADEQEVLRLWQGLGYYSRARNLLATAKKIMADFDGQVPPSVEKLKTLPGIGPYTAGAIASIAFNQSAPILDGNVTRVLCRLDLITGDPAEPKNKRKLWKRAQEILPKKRIGDFNSALMELGATLCARAPKCKICPVQSHCVAFSKNLQFKVPPPKKHRPLLMEHRWTFCISHQDKYLIEKRAPGGRWTSMWQFVTLLQQDRSKRLAVTKKLGIKITTPKPLSTIIHTLSHRHYTFEVFTAECKDPGKLNPSQPNPPPRHWVPLNELHFYPLPKPQLEIAKLLKGLEGAKV
jgi:A/G-specific adenine glycosylase